MIIMVFEDDGKSVVLEGGSVEDLTFEQDENGMKIEQDVVLVAVEPAGED